jgi:phytoene/squalene synthetase
MKQKEIFDKISIDTSRLITREYSTSFSLSIYCLHRSLRRPIYAIYGFVRLADEIVDSFLDYDRKAIINDFIRETHLAIERGVSMNPVLNAFQHVVNEYKIDKNLIDAFLCSMEMDTERLKHDENSFRKYIYGSAEVVGLMCLKVFVDKDNEKYEELMPYARSLGSAFQKVNFLRDAGNDYKFLGRIYFPGIDFENLNNSTKQKIEMDIEDDFKHALVGIRKLPLRARFGVYVAYVYYYNLLKKIQALPCKALLKNRIRISNFPKLFLLFKSIIDYKLKLN